MTVLDMRIILAVLFVLGIILLFALDRPIEGILALGPVGAVMLFLLNILLATLLLSFVPGVFAAIVVGGFVADKLDSGLALIVGLIVLIGVTSAIFHFIWRWLIPFALGFSISLFVGKVVAVFVSLIFSGNEFRVPDIAGSLEDISRVRLSELLEIVPVISRSLESLWSSVKLLWNTYPVIFVGAVIFGIVYAAVLGSEEQEDEKAKN